MTEIWLRNVGDQEDECWVVCNKIDPGATLFIPAAYSVHANRLIDDLTLMNQALIAEKSAKAPIPVPAGASDGGARS